MAYIAADQLTLERMSKMDTGEFELALSDLKEAGLSEQGATYLSAYINPPYQARVLADAAYDAKIAELKAAATAVLNAQGVGSDAYKTTKRDLDLVIAADAGRRHNEKFKGVAPYLYLWPFPFYEESKRTANNIPLIFSFKLNGDALQSRQEMVDYWLDNPAILWPILPITYPDLAYKKEMWASFLAHAPDYRYFLLAIKHLIAASKITITSSNVWGGYTGRYDLPWYFTPAKQICDPPNRWGSVYCRYVASGEPYDWHPIFDPTLTSFMPQLWRDPLQYGYTAGLLQDSGTITRGSPVHQGNSTNCNHTGFQYSFLNSGERPQKLDWFFACRTWAGADSYPSSYTREMIGAGFRKAINAPDMPWMRNTAAMDKGGEWKAVKDFPATINYTRTIGSSNMYAHTLPFLQPVGGFGRNQYAYVSNAGKWNRVDPSEYFGRVGETDVGDPFVLWSSLELLRVGVEQEANIRFGYPPPPRPSKRSWFWKFLSFVPFIIPFLAPIASLGNLALKLISVAAGQIVAKQVGGVLGSVLGAITGGTINWSGATLGMNSWGTIGTAASPTALSFDSLGLNAEHSIAEASRLGISIPPSFEPIASSLAPASYGLVQSITSALPVGQPIQNILGAGLNAAMNNYVGVPAEWLNTLSTSPLIQAGIVAASIAAPQPAKIGLGALSLAQNYDKLTPTTFTEFRQAVPVIETASLLMFPDQSREIKLVADVAEYSPNLSGDWSIPDLSTVVSRIPELIVEGIEETGKAIVRAPELLAQGMTYASEHITDLPPLILEGVQETAKVVVRAPELAMEGLTAIPSALTKLEMPDMNQFQFPSMQMEIPKMPAPTVQTVVTVQDGTKTVTKESVPTSVGTTGETIIHLPAVPIRDTNLPLLVIGGLAILTAAAASRKN